MEMDYRKKEYKFIKVANSETRDQLISLGFTEITEPSSSTYCFINDGKKLTFDVENFGGVYTNVLFL
jgi:hypothetical protein